MQHSSLCPRLLKRCSLLKISPSVKAIGTHATRPDSLSPPTLYPKQCQTPVFCSASTSLLCGGKVPRQHTLLCTTGSKPALIFLVCNSRVTQLTWVDVPWNRASRKPTWTCPLAPVSAPNYLCTLGHPCRCCSEDACLHAGWRMNAHSSCPLFTYACKHTRILKCTHPFPFSRIHLRTYTDLFESSCFQKGFIYRSCLVVNVKGRKPLRGFLSCVNQPRLRALGSPRGGFHS